MYPWQKWGTVVNNRTRCLLNCPDFINCLSWDESKEADDDENHHLAAVEELSVFDCPKAEDLVKEEVDNYEYTTGPLNQR